MSMKVGRKSHIMTLLVLSCPVVINNTLYFVIYGSMISQAYFIPIKNEAN
jgi:hypothetical protein